MQAHERIVKLLLSVGTNGSGKTHQMKALLKVRKRNLVIPADRADKNWKGFPELRAEIRWRIDPRDPKQKRQVPYYVIPKINSFTGTRVIYIEGDDRERKGIFEAIIHRNTGFSNGSLFMDDFKNYIDTDGPLPGNVRTFFGNRRIKMVDIIMAAWTFTDVHPAIIGFNPQMFVFNVVRPPNDAVRDKVPDFDGLVATWKRVRARNLQLPEGRQWYFEPFPPIKLKKHENTARTAPGHR